MPSLAPRICACQKVVPAGQRCACQQRRDAARKARHDATRPSAAARGYGHKWRMAREQFLAINPKCIRCGAPSTVVDHIIPHKRDLKLFWRRSNWQPLCQHCHNRAKQALECREITR